MLRIVRGQRDACGQAGEFGPAEPGLPLLDRPAVHADANALVRLPPLQILEVGRLKVIKGEVDADRSRAVAAQFEDQRVEQSSIGWQPLVGVQSGDVHNQWQVSPAGFEVGFVESPVPHVLLYERELELVEVLSGRAPFERAIRAEHEGRHRSAFQGIAGDPSAQRLHRGRRADGRRSRARRPFHSQTSLEPPEIDDQVRRVLVAECGLLLQGFVQNRLKRDSEPRVHAGRKDRGCVRIAADVSTAVLPSKAFRLAAISNSTAPRLKKSLRTSTSSPRTCSGDMYAYVPSGAPICVSGVSAVRVV